MKKHRARYQTSVAAPPELTPPTTPAELTPPAGIQWSPSGAGYDLRQQARSRVHRSVGVDIGRVWVDEADNLRHHQVDAMEYMLRAKQQRAAAMQQWPKALEDYRDAELVMEMIRRGYAVMKLPEDGGPPEALR